MSSWHRIVGDKIVEEWSLNDALDVMLSALEHRCASAWARSCWWQRHPASPPSPRRCPPRGLADLPPSTSPPERWEETSTTSTSSQRVRVGLVVGDATGKGVPAALVMSTTCGMLQAV